jgi:hypothetical protein
MAAMVANLMPLPAGALFLTFAWAAPVLRQRQSLP